jgi:hypothetical protein
MAEVNPYAATEAFYRQQNYSQGQRAEREQTAQNKLAQLYAANQDSRAASAEQRAQAGVDATQQDNAQKIDMQAREQVGVWANNLLSRQDIDDNARVQIIQQAAQNPATADVLRRAGIAQMDWANPEQVLRGLHGAAGWGVKVSEPFTLGPGQKRFGADGKPIASVAPNPQKGMRIQSDGAGGFSLYEGPDAEGVDLTTPTKNKLQEGAINAQAGIDRLAGVRTGFDPRWLTYKGQFSQYVNSIRSKAAGFPFVSNRYITEITGAAMGVEEAKRIVSTMPSLDDDPQSFQTKLDRVEERLKLVLARSVYTQRNGIKFDAIPIDQMKSIMNRRGDEIYRQKLAQTNDTNAARQATIAALNSEFYQ